MAAVAVISSVVAAAPAAGLESRNFEPGYAMSKQYVAVTAYKVLRDHAPSTVAGCESDVKDEPDRFDDLSAAGAFTRGSINCLDKLGYLSGLPGGSGSSFEPGYAMSKQYVAVTVYKILRDHAPSAVAGCERNVKNEPDRFDDLSAAGAFTRGSINCLDKLGYLSGLPGITPMRTLEFEREPRDLSGQSPQISVKVSDRRPVTGTALSVTATVTDDAGRPLSGAGLELYVDDTKYMLAISDSQGRANFAYSAPVGNENQGGYDSVRVQVWSTDVITLPVGIFWQPPLPRRITLTASPDRPHTNAERTLTAKLFEGNRPLPGQSVNLRIDGEPIGSARTDNSGEARFIRSEAFHGPFDLVTAELASDPSVVSEEVLISWPMRTRGVDSRNDWQIVWSDEFNGTSLDAGKWTASDDCPPVYLSCNTDRAENVNLADGMLHLRSLREPFEGINTWQGCGQQTGPIRCTPGQIQRKDFTAGRVNSVEYFTFGRLEILARLPQGIGTFFAIWMAPRRDSPYGTGHAAGELDIAEGVNIGRGGNPRGYVDGQLPGPGWLVHHFVKTGYPTNNLVTYTHMPVNPAESFHLYTIEWDAESVRYYVDDQRVMTVPSSDWFADPEGDGVPVNNPYAPFDEPFRLILSNTVGSWAVHNTPGNLVPDSTVFPTEMVVDYVRYYECRPASGTSGLGPGQGCETP